MDLDHQLVGRFSDRDEALEEFFRVLEAHNGRRRRSPREIVRVLRVKRVSRGGWRIKYRVPARYLH